MPFVFLLNLLGNKRIIEKWGDELAAAKKIKMLLVEREMTLTDLSKLLDRSLSTLSGKMTRDNFSERDLKQIADVLNFEYEAVFTDKETGKKI